MSARIVIGKFGGQTRLAALVGKGQSTIAYWAKTDVIPAQWQSVLLRLARQNGIPLDLSDFVSDIKSNPDTVKYNNINVLTGKTGTQAATSKQLVLDIGIQIERDVNGIEMGILENGIPFLTQNGLARIAGSSRSVIYDIAQEWAQNFDNDVLGNGRHAWLRNYLSERGYSEPLLYIETKRNGQAHYAYPDIVCMAVIEYYAFEAQTKNQTAIDNFRRLATYGLQRFIFDSLNYTPADKWKHFHDRVTILNDAAPDGYFIVFHEVTGLISDLIAAGLPVNDKTIPDISVGRVWGMYWSANGCDARFGSRIKYEHYYPSYYRQAQSNPQEPWAYPDAALPTFRHWFRHEYLPTKYPSYILSKSHLLGGQQKAKLIADMYIPLQIGNN